MADISSLIDSVLGVAKKLSPLIPTLSNGVALGEKVIDLIDDLKSDAPDQRTAAQMDADREALSDRVKAKAAKTSDRLRGN
jgi:hypothetical protein